MGARVLNDGNVSAMRSSINWAVLGLLIEQPGHGYDLFKRFDDAYAGAIELSSHTQINGALKAFKERDWIERLPEEASNPDAQSQRRISYRASAEGLRVYEHYMMTYSPRRADAPGVFARHVAALPPHIALVVLERFEQACLSETSGIRIERSQARPPADTDELQARSIAEEKHLALAAKIQWARYTRSQIKALASAQMDGVPARPADGRTDAWALRRVGEEGSAQ
jgi:DNA-binding PadR family transcriptional regulator